MTTMDITHSRAEAPESAEAVGPNTRRAETPMMSELVVATLHPGAPGRDGRSARGRDCRSRERHQA